MLASWGRFVHRHRVVVLLLSVLLLSVSVFGLVSGGQLSNKWPENVESGEALKLLQDELPATGSSFVFLFLSPTLDVDDPAFERAMRDALAPLQGHDLVASVQLYHDAPADAKPQMRSDDGHAALARVTLTEPFDEARKDYEDLRALVRSDTLEVRATGDLPITADFDSTLEKDLQRGEVVSLPLTLLLLLLVFGTLVAALLPLGVGALAVVGGIAGVYALSRFLDVSTYAVNIVTLIGLGVAIDYSLFVVSRHREELAKGLTVEAALARSMETAGRAVFFSGLTVAIGLSGLLFFEGTFLASMGMAGAIVVALAVLYALTFLPAFLGLLGHRVEKGSVIPKKWTAFGARGGFWHALATSVMKRPLMVLVPVLALLLVAGAPFLHVRLSNGDFHMLPEDTESRQAAEMLDAQFPGQDENAVLLVAQFPGEPLTRERVGALYDLSRRVAAIDGVDRVESIVDLDPRMTREDYQDLLTSPRESWPQPLKDAAERAVGNSIVVLRAVTSQDHASDEARDLVAKVREDRAVGDGRLLVGGQTAFDVDFIDFILERAPTAVAFIVVVTYVLLLLQVGSFLIPLKAIVMNLLSISASFGALVWVFQDGHLQWLMGFTPQPIDPTLPVIMFCIVFGLSMDYEVLLLSRMREEWARSKDNTAAVATGLEKSGRLITGAAAIMVIVFAAFALSRVVIIQAIGFGLALAVLLDATLVRALIVPATMRLLGRANWWGPRVLQRFAAASEH